MVREQGQKFVAQNKKARHDYHIDDTYEAGLVLVGTEVKSLRQGRASLVDGFADVDGGEAWGARAGGGGGGGPTPPPPGTPPGPPAPPPPPAASASCCCTPPRSPRS